jgi:hypothetical protein
VFKAFSVFAHQKKCCSAVLWQVAIGFSAFPNDEFPD